VGADAIVAIGFVLLLIGGAVAGGVSLYRRGKLTAQLKDAKGDAREATDQIKRRTDPVLSDRSYFDRLRRASERLARLRNRASK
jgi:hypothetical protein